jgi:ankyrin repeat protein
MDSSNLTPLDTAVGMGDVAVVRVLVEGKADVNAQANWSKTTPLHLAAILAETACVRILLEAKANVNAINVHGETALFDLLLQSQDYLMHGQISTTTVFLEQGVDLSLKDKYGTTIGEAIKRPVWHIPPEVQQSPGWQFIHEHARGQSKKRKLCTL